MINLVKKENINLSILETDFDVFADIVNTFSSEGLKKDCLIDLDEYIIPEYFKNKLTLVIQSNKMLIGYATFEFKNTNNISQVEINKLYILDEFKNKNMEAFLIEGIIYIAGEVGSRNVLVSVDEHDEVMYKIYKNIGFYEVGMNEDGNLLSANVISVVNLRKLNDKFRDIPKDAIDYKSLKLVKKITSGRSGNIYLTEDGKILKMFTSNSFTYIKDREETLKAIGKLDIKEIVKPKNLVYYDGVFVGYIMEYLPEGDALWPKCETYSFEKKIDKIKEIEEVLKELHSKNIYVCDLNPDNIFFDKTGSVKLIDCDSFVIKENALNNSVDSKYKDPMNKVVSKKTDLYTFAIMILEVLLDKKIPKESTISDIEKIYNKNKSKFPASFKNYFEHIFKGQERFYLTDSYENYINEIYNSEDDSGVNNKSGKISVIILSIILVIIAVIGYFVFKASA